MSTLVVKPQIISEYKTHEKDTGSSEVQIALLTARINHLTEHLRTHRKDFHSRRGLLQMASRRRKLLDYLKRTNLPKYNELLQKLNLRKEPFRPPGDPIRGSPVVFSTLDQTGTFPFGAPRGRRRTPNGNLSCLPGGRQ